jgi:hypothetical protein
LLLLLSERPKVATDIGTASMFILAIGFTSARPQTAENEPLATAKEIHEVAITQNGAENQKKKKEKKGGKKTSLVYS